MADRLRPIARRFAEALPTYDRAADIQRQTAADLLREVAALPLPVAPRVLELGCGPGTLTIPLRRQFPRMQAVISDIAPAMAAACRDRLALDADGATSWFVAMDGEQPAIAEGAFDLICANLAVQWFRDLAGSLARLTAALRPGGFLAVTTLGSETFREWRAAHARFGLTPATPAYPSIASLKSELSSKARLHLMRDDILVSQHPSALAFLHSLRQIGADFPDAGTRPLSAGAMRRVLQAMDAEKVVTVSYQVVTLILQRHELATR
jgi:malonyl-CoA O-methyltransferase